MPEKNLIFYNARMEPLRELGRTLFFLGSLLIIVGAILYFNAKLPFRLGKLPGDIVHRGEHTTFYFPIVTCLVLSLALSLLFWLFSHFRR
jgi:H+/Cl- antiporter ClcA